MLGLPDEVDGDLPMAVVVLKPDQTATEEEIIAYMDGNCHFGTTVTGFTVTIVFSVRNQVVDVVYS